MSHNKGCNRPVSASSTDKAVAKTLQPVAASCCRVLVLTCASQVADGVCMPKPVSYSVLYVGNSIAA